MGRDIVYDRWSCDLLCAASSPDLYRINLEQGHFLSPLNMRSPAINVVCRSLVHGLVACDGEDGALECFDLRQKVAVGRINAVAPTGDSDQGDGMTSIEPASGNINDVCVIRNSGLMFMALESTQIPSYFIPSLGPAPKWCSYLENLTEELEEGAQTTIYDDFKFVTKEDIERLNLTNLIGTNLLRAYMHGFFVDYRLYLKAKSMADPFAYEAYRQQRIQEKIEAERAARITIKRKLPKVNKDLAARLLATEDAEEGENEHEDGEDLVQQNASKKKKRVGSELLKDERFAAMFHDEVLYSYLKLSML